VSGTDTQIRFHEEWLGLAQPIHGLVFSVPVLAEAQIAPTAGPELTARFRAWLEDPEGAPSVRDLRAFFDGYFGYSAAGMLVPRAELPDTLRFYADEGGQELRPSFAIARGPFAPPADDLFGTFGAPEAPTAPAEGPPWLALAWDVRDDAKEAGLGLSLDEPENATGPWRYPPTYKLERLLRHTGIPIGLLSNGRELRLVYAPSGEATSHLTFRFADMNEPSGRPILAAFELLLAARRTYESAPENTVEGLLRQSTSGRPTSRRISPSRSSRPSRSCSTPSSRPRSAVAPPASTGSAPPSKSPTTTSTRASSRWCSAWCSSSTPRTRP
jgi:hypothetical protein